MSRFEYSTDQVNGNMLMFLDQEQSWVEKINESTELFRCQCPRPKMWEKFRLGSASIVRQNFLELDGKLGIVQQLADERIFAPFALPPMLSMDSSGLILYGTGMSRLTAEFMCGTPVEQISMIVACDDANRLRANFEQVLKLNTTKEFEDIYKLEGVDYSIVWEPNNAAVVRFVNSILRHSVYESFQETDKYFTGINNSRLQYLDIFSRNNKNKKIEINVYCTKDQEKFFTQTDSVFDITFLHQPPEEWSFSYGRLMGAFRSTKQGRDPMLNIWAFDINQPVDLYFLLMWINSDRPSFYTKNRKLTVFNPTNVTVIKEIPDLIK